MTCENGDGTEKVVWHVVKKFAAKLGIANLAPHDLRRTCARLCHAAALPGLQAADSVTVNDCIGIEPRT